MTTNSIRAFIAAAVCSTVLISSANAGGHHRGFGASSSAATSTTSAVLPTGRSPLGEPVFLIPTILPSHQSSNGHHPLSPAREQVHIMKPTTTGSDRSTHVIFTPPPTIVPQGGGVSGGGNGNGSAGLASNKVSDHVFGPSILNAGLNSKPSNSLPNQPELFVSQSDLDPAGIAIGPGPQGPPTLNRVSATVTSQKSGPTVQVPTTSSMSKSTSTTTATGH